MNDLIWRSIDLLMQIVLRSHIAGDEDREEWAFIVNDKRELDWHDEETP